ncbi:CLUMA_CG011477, isoform A [Clunio marinus]|uniref:CLUMA_CG011477, isoform A n=1 Tax=Clunio marinus TaxID=568069 RepID=A0A1J1ICU8_9DIPT|nr:CLUMA_CG011477, isoform A [Clunio marinus]
MENLQKMWNDGNMTQFIMNLRDVMDVHVVVVIRY